MQIRVDAQRLAQYGLTVQQVASALRSADADHEPSGRPTVLRPAVKVSSLEELESSVVAQVQGRPVRLAEIARIHVAAREPECACADEAVVCAQVTLRGEAARDAVRKTLRDLGRQVPAAVSIREAELPAPPRTAVVCGDTLETLRAPAERLAALARDAGHAPTLLGTSTKPELRLRADRARLAQVGLSPRDVARTVRAAQAGESVMQFRVGAQTMSVSLFVGDNAESPDDLGRLLVQTPAGPAVPLSAVAPFELGLEPAMVLRHNGRRCLAVTVPEADGVGSWIASVPQQLELDPGQTVEWLPEGLIVPL